MKKKNPLKETRVKCGMTQVETAKRFGISLRTYVMYENTPENTIKYKYMLRELEKLALVDEEHGILTTDEIREVCANIGSEHNLRYCILFGSYAKGKAAAKSDVDILVSSGVKGLDFYGMVEDFAEALHKKVDVLNVEHLLNNKELLEEILQYGIRVYG